VHALVARLDVAQRMWLSGYLAGSAHGTLPEPVPVQSAAPLVTVLYGSQTGNAQNVARGIADALAQRGIAHTLIDMLECKKNELEQAQILLVVVSTHGEGEPPDRAVPLYELLHGRKAPKLAHLRYAVLALGDSSYEKFCQTGKDFDARLEALGAQRLHPRADCDVDYEETARAWTEGVLARIAEIAPAGAAAAAAVRPAASLASVSNAYTRKNPFHAPVLTNQRLTARGSTKDVRHIELSLEGSNIRYEPGDAIGIPPRNHASDVDALLEVLRFDPETPVGDATPQSLRQALTERYDIGPLSASFVERYAAAIKSDELARILSEENRPALAKWLRGRHVIDLVQEYPPVGLDAAAFAQLLRPLAPRLYSIASSQRVVPDEVHLTVGLVEYESFGRRRRGVVSGMLADLTDEDATVPIYLHRNTSFRLPADPDRAIIMIGPGTGVAPFRAFVAEREAIGARGASWLFFGDRNFETDFLYQAEWLDWRKRGVLQRIDVAFSRDQNEKIYVQHRMLEQGARLWEWLQEGAYVYVCGDAEHMAPDVHAALLQIIERHGGYSAEGAAEYLLQLQREARYQRDVY